MPSRQDTGGDKHPKLTDAAVIALTGLHPEFNLSHNLVHINYDRVSTCDPYSLESTGEHTVCH